MLFAIRIGCILFYRNISGVLVKNAAFLIPEMMWRCGLAPLPFWKSSDSDELLLGTAAIGIDDVHTLLKALNGVILGLNLAG